MNKLSITTCRPTQNHYSNLAEFFSQNTAKDILELITDVSAQLVELGDEKMFLALANSKHAHRLQDIINQLRSIESVGIIHVELVENK